MTAQPAAVHLEFTYTPQEWREGRLAATTGTGSPRRVYLGVAAWVGCIALAVMVVNLVNTARVPPPSAPVAAEPQASFFRSVLLPLIPWALIFGSIMVFILRQQFGLLGGWKRNPLFQAVQSLDLDERGVRLATTIAESRWQWEAFSGTLETPRLLLLRLTSKAVVIIPKRAADPTQLEMIRRLVRENAPAAAGISRTAPADLPDAPAGPGDGHG